MSEMTIPRIKKLPLQSWQRTIARKYQCLASEKELKAYGTLSSYEKAAYPNNKTCELGDGYYLQGEESWFTHNGERYDVAENGKSTFLYTLNRVSILEGFTTIEDVQKLRKLELRVHGSISTRTQRSLAALFEVNSKRNVKLKVMRFRKRIKESRSSLS